jgi:hypothetical protein
MKCRALLLVLTAPLLAISAVPASARAPRGSLPAARQGLTPARGQPVPHSLLGSEPIPAVREATAAAREDAAIPAPLNPESAAQDPPYLYIPYRCVPKFGPGATFDICPSGDTRSRHTVALIGDSHAWMWIPGLNRVASALQFRLVPVTKPGCLLSNLHEDRPGWPCLTWYVHALQVIRRLHPSATIVSFMTSNLTPAKAPWAAAALDGVLRAVPHGLLLADPPNYNVSSGTSDTPGECLAAAGSNLGTCARQEPPAMRATLPAIQAMARQDGYPAVPTLQWFCAGGICPAVIDGTVASEDGSHITSQYSMLLAPLLTDAIRPLLGGLWLREAGL